MVQIAAGSGDHATPLADARGSVRSHDLSLGRKQVVTGAWALTGIIALLLAATAGYAQPAPMAAQETARALQLLHSTRCVDKAWGAFFAGRLHSDDLREPLLEALRNAAPLGNALSDTDEYGFVAALFDALIEGDIAAPAEALRSFEERWSNPVLILLSRSTDKDSEDALLRIGGEKSHEMEWLAANNLLFERRSQRWYAGILSSVTVTHRFTLTDPGKGGYGAGAGGGVSGDGVAAMPKGFPPITLYTLQGTPGRGSVLLAQGPRDVYYKKTVVPTDKRVGFGSSNAFLDRMTMQIDYLGALGNMPAYRAERLFHADTHIPCRSAEECMSQIAQSLDAQEQDIRGLIHTIETRGLRCPSGIRYQIAPDVKDQRTNAADSLPVPAPREIVLN